MLGESHPPSKALWKFTSCNSKPKLVQLKIAFYLLKISHSLELKIYWSPIFTSAAGGAAISCSRCPSSDPFGKSHPPLRRKGCSPCSRHLRMENTQVLGKCPGVGRHMMCRSRWPECGCTGPGPAAGRGCPPVRCTCSSWRPEEKESCSSVKGKRRAVLGSSCSQRSLRGLKNLEMQDP